MVDADFDRFDLILAMDWDNLALLEERCPPPHRAQAGPPDRTLPRARQPASCPTPTQGGAPGFEQVLDLVEDACDGLVARCCVGKSRAA